jgi:hypothetical protein
MNFESTMQDLKQTLQDECYGRNLEQRKRWYSPAAEAYQQVRPRYPQALIDRVIDAASSFHWIQPEIGYPKAAAALRPDGYLILLWNKELQPRYEVYQQLSEAFQTHAPTLNRSFENGATQSAILDEMGQMAIASGYFKDLVAGHVEVKVTYTIDQYLLLLNTYSPYLKLEEQQKQSLFAELRQVLEQNRDMVQLSYVSAFHISRPA